MCWPTRYSVQWGHPNRLDSISVERDTVLRARDDIIPCPGPHRFLSLAARELGFRHGQVICLIALESMKRRSLRMNA